MNEAINFLKTRRCHEPLAETAEPADGSPSAVDLLAQDKVHQDLHRAVLALDPKYGAVIYLFHFLQMSYEAVAEALDLPEKTVKSRLFSARQLLRADLERHGHGS